MLKLLLKVSAPLLAACTMIGIDHPAMRQAMDFGPAQTVNFCVYLDDGVTPGDADRLLDSWNHTEGDKYRLYVNALSYESKVRQAIIRTTLQREVAQTSLHGRCDRAIWFVNRGPADYIYGTVISIVSIAGIPIPEILGETDDATLTRVYVYTKADSINGMILNPWRVTRHELYHALGCAKHYDMPDCYRRIQMLKTREKQLLAGGYFRTIGESEFYPTFKDLGYETLDSRSQVNKYLVEAFPIETGRP
jgi:hypothetical protein